MKILSLSGWGQPPDALHSIAADATHFDYADYKALDTALPAIAKAAQAHDVVMGWSLGGQLAVLAIACGLMRPEKLVLIGTPFQFVRGTGAHGMPQDTYQLFRDNFARDPQRTLRKAWDLIAYQDAQEAAVRTQLEQYELSQLLQKDWAGWLNLLEEFNCDGLPFEHFPPTLLIHGDRDAVVHCQQAQLYARRLPQHRLEIVAGCGHAPHWHDPAKVGQLVREFVHV